MSEIRAVAWTGFLTQFGWLWASLPDWWWRPVVLIPLVYVSAQWLAWDAS